MKKLFLALFTVVASLTLIACKTDKGGNVELKVAVNFDGTRFISYNQPQPYKALDGKEYTKGDLSPTWSKIGENLGIDFVDKGFELGKKNTDTQYQDAKVDGFKDMHLINGTGANITNDRKDFVNLAPYIESGKMPNLKAFLESQTTYESYLKASDGGIYYTPYLDGDKEVELGYLMRIDWTEKILDTTEAADTGTFPAGYTGLTNTTPHNPAALDTEILVAEKGGKTRTVNIKYTQNIITQLKTGPQTSKAYLDTFRNYISETRKGQGYEKLSHVFTGFDAGYLTDELVALMAVVKANPQLLEGRAQVEVYFPRETKGSRVRNLFRGLEMYGVRGAVSKNNWLYLDEEGNLNDSRNTQEGIGAINKLSDMYNDKLIFQNFQSFEGGNIRDALLNDANGFLTYDYNATQTAASTIAKAKEKNANYRFESILPPVNDWKGTGEYFHFTESVRSLKNEAWGITKAATGKELEKAIELVDYLYEPTEGANLFLYGPQEWRHATETVDYKGEAIPKFSDKALEEIKDPAKGKGNMINYLRDFVGATLPVGHVRSLGLELQTLTDQGKAGYDRVRNAISTNVLRLSGVYDGDDSGVWYNPVPNVFALTTAQENQIKQTKAEFDKYWGDNELYKIVHEGIRGDRKTAYDALFVHNGTAWWDSYIGFYQEAYNKIA